MLRRSRQSCNILPRSGGWRYRAIAFGGAECFRRTCRPTSLPLDRQIRRLGLPEVWIARSRPSGWAKCDCPGWRYGVLDNVLDFTILVVVQTQLRTPVAVSRLIPVPRCEVVDEQVRVSDFRFGHWGRVPEHSDEDVCPALTGKRRSLDGEAVAQVLRTPRIGAH